MRHSAQHSYDTMVDWFINVPL